MDIKELIIGTLRLPVSMRRRVCTYANGDSMTTGICRSVRA